MRRTRTPSKRLSMAVPNRTTPHSAAEIDSDVQASKGPPRATDSPRHTWGSRRANELPFRHLGMAAVHSEKHDCQGLHHLFPTPIEDLTVVDASAVDAGEVRSWLQEGSGYNVMRHKIYWADEDGRMQEASIQGQLRLAISVMFESKASDEIAFEMREQGVEVLRMVMAIGKGRRILMELRDGRYVSCMYVMMEDDGRSQRRVLPHKLHNCLIGRSESHYVIRAEGRRVTLSTFQYRVRA